MPFMQIQITRGAYVVECAHGDCGVYPAEFSAPTIGERCDYIESRHPVESFEHSPGFIARLSAPGYLDATEWSGPYATEKEAREAMAEMLDLEGGD